MKVEFMRQMADDLTRRTEVYAALLLQRDHLWGQLAACRASLLAVAKLIRSEGGTCKLPWTGEE